MPPERSIATILFTDIVGSTERATELGDRGWGDLLEQHNELVRRELRRFHGKEISTAGDSFLAVFDGPALWSTPKEMSGGSPSTSGRV
jgi:class 3 adenylate cyclase